MVLLCSMILNCIINLEYEIEFNEYFYNNFKKVKDGFIDLEIGNYREKMSFFLWDVVCIKVEILYILFIL